MIKATSAPAVTKKHLAWVPFVYAGLLVVAIVAQLLSFTEFIEQLTMYRFPSEVAAWVASGIVLAEVFALPFVLRLSLSSLGRQASAVLSMLVPLVWLGLVICATARHNMFVEAAYFGSVLSETADWTWIFGNILVFCLSVWVFLLLGGPSAFKNRLSKAKK